MKLLGVSTMLASAFALQAVELKVDYLIEPIAIQNALPSFSFSIDAGDDRGVISTGFTIDVTELANDGSPKQTVWSTNIESNQTTFIRYPKSAVALKSNTDYAWRCRYGNEKATVSKFSTALFNESDWEGSEWVQAKADDAAQMRKEFNLPSGKITRARAYFAMPGYGKLFLNGAAVDGDAGTRTWSQYDKRTIYACYDIKDVITTGTNAVGVYAGRGWYGHFGYGPPAFRIIITATVDGKTVTIGSNATWMMTPGPVISNDEYNGEIYDARLETPGWTKPFFTSGAEQWTPAILSSTNKGFRLTNAKLDAMSFPAVDVMHTLTAKWWKEPSPGVYVFDFEQNLSGWIKLVLDYCTAGTTIQFRHAELLQHPPYGPVDGNIYVGNLRSAKATDTYTCKGAAEGETWMPSFTQHGFRYVEVTGLESAPTLDMVTAINVRSAVEQAGTIAFSDPMMNNVQHNILWGQATNLMMIPTDCDQRDERFGWTGDSALTAEEGFNNFDLGAMFQNWIQMIDESSPNGAVGDTVPGGPGSGNLPATKSADASWSSVYPSVAYALMKYNGDTTTVKKHWTGLKRFIDNEWAHILTTNGTRDITNMFHQFGDWCPPPPQRRLDSRFSAGFSFINDMAAVVEIAQNVGTAEEVANYTAILEQSRKMFHESWYDSENQLYTDGHDGAVQTAQVLALQIQAPPDTSTKNSVLQHLVHDIVNVSKNHTTCGIIGWRWELDVLSANGYGDVAYALITQQTYPGYGYEILHEYEPATTIWELWNSDVQGNSMNSRDHIMFGGPGKWIYNYVGGIGQTDESIGFEHVVLSPPASLIEQSLSNVVPGGPNSTISAPLDFVTASHKTLRGVIALEWMVHDPKDPNDSTCASGDATQEKVALSCPGNKSSITAVAFAAHGVISGTCGTGFKHSTTCSSSSTFQDFVKKCCVGRHSCSYHCEKDLPGNDKESICLCDDKTNVTIPNPCYGTHKSVAGKVTCDNSGDKVVNFKVVIPPGSDSQLVVPLLGSGVNDVVITENGTTVFENGKYLDGMDGITGAKTTDDAVIILHGSGTYHFVRSG